MAAGLTIARGSLTTNADTAIVTPTSTERVYIYWMTFTVSVVGTTSRLRVENGLGGAVLARMSTVTADSLLNINYSTGDIKNWKANALSVGTLLNVNTSGAAAATVDYEIAYEVRG